MSHLASRSARIQPFQVMRLLARARELEAQGRDIVHMEVGEPDFPTPPAVIAAAQRSIADGAVHYTPATGLPALREAIAESYRDRYQVNINPARIVIAPGSSGALLLCMAALIEPGKKIMLADPGYPCNRNFSYFLNGEINAVPVDASSEYQLTAKLIEKHWDDDTVAVIIASPSNPTGTLVNALELQDIAQVVQQLDGAIIMDEIYHGLVYGTRAHSILEYTHDAFVINSFSKFYGMTGWRVGWCVVPEQYIEIVDKYAQNIFLAAPTPAQHAALAAFSAENLAELERRRQAFAARRDFLLPAIAQLGFKVNAVPQGAFYIYADCSALTDDSAAFCEALLEQAGVAITPGMDFGTHRAAQHVRFAYTTAIERLQTGVERIAEFLKQRG